MHIKTKTFSNKKLIFCVLFFKLISQQAFSLEKWKEKNGGKMFFNAGSLTVDCLTADCQIANCQTDF